MRARRAPAGPNVDDGCSHGNEDARHEAIRASASPRPPKLTADLSDEIDAAKVIDNEATEAV